MNLILLKIVLAPALIGLVSLAGRKWGPGISGWLLGIPVNTGPILLLFVLEQGRDFAAHAALGALLGILVWATFTLVYAWCCLRLAWWWSAMIGWIACGVVAWLLTSLKISTLGAFVLVYSSVAAVILILPKAPEGKFQVAHSRSELWLRMITATAIIFVLTGIAHELGPRASGILSAFPAYTTILAVFNHRMGSPAAVQVLRGVSAGLYTAATFFLVLSLSLVRWGALASFTLAILAALAVQGGSLIFVRRVSRSGLRTA